MSDWQPIETAPRDGTTIYVRGVIGRKWRRKHKVFWTVWGWESYTTDDFVDYCTDWRPLEPGTLGYGA